MEFIKKKDGYDFNCQRISRKTGKPIEVLVLNKKSKYKSGLKYAKENEVNNLSIDLDLSQKDLELLKEIPLEFLELKNLNKNSDLTFLNEFGKLEYLAIQSSTNGSLDLNELPKLEVLNLTDGLELVNIDKAINLKTFYLWDSKSNSIPDFGEINIEKIHLYNSSIETIKGLENCSTIKEVRIENCRNLTSIDSLEKSSKSILDLALINCKNLLKYDVLIETKNLEKLALKNCGVMSNTSFLSNLQKLKKGYIDINIEDGKVDLLMEMPIIFKNYKHFNFKNNLKEFSLRYGHSGLKRGKVVVYEETFTDE